MRKYWKLFIFVFSPIVFLTCAKKTQEEINWDNNWAFINSFDFPQSSKKTDYYFKGFDDGVSFNFAADDTTCSSDFVGSSITYSPTNVITNSQLLYFGRTTRFLGQPILKPPTNFAVLLTFSFANTQRTADSLLRLFLDEKIEPFYAKARFGSQQHTDSLGFVLDCSAVTVDGIGIVAETGAYGDQTGSYIKVKTVVKSLGLYEDYYDVTFSIKCKFYVPRNGEMPVLYKTITDGEMRTRIILPHY